MIPMSSRRSFYAQLAVMQRAFDALEWQRWTPRLYACVGGVIDRVQEELWAPYLRDVTIIHCADSDTAEQGIWAQGDAQLRFAPADADVIMCMDADALPLAAFEDVLDKVVEDGSVAGVIAHDNVPPRRLPTKGSWDDIAADIGYAAPPLDFKFCFPNRTEPEWMEAPFYVNFGAVFMAKKAFDALYPKLRKIRPKLTATLEKPHYSQQVAFSFAAHAAKVPVTALPVRYNVPNDPKAIELAREEVDNAIIFHYLRTTEFDRAKLFEWPTHYQEFAQKDLSPINEVFRRHIIELLGTRYPFPLSVPPAKARAQLDLPQSALDALSESRLARRRHLSKSSSQLADLDVEIHFGAEQEIRVAQAMRRIVISGLFDQEFYETQVDPTNKPKDLLRHYLNNGEPKGLLPNKMFDPTFYRAQHLPAGYDGSELDHYVTVGHVSGAAPHAAFLPDVYLARLGLDSSALPNPLFHWLHCGQEISPQGPENDGEEYAEAFAKHPSKRVLDQLMHYKRSLVGRYGISAGFTCMQDRLALSNDQQVHRLDIVSQHSYLLERDWINTTSHVGGNDFSVAPPERLGGPQQRTMIGKERTIYLGQLEKPAMVRGASILIDVGDAVLFDFEGNELESLETEIDFDAAAFHVEGRSAWMMQPENRSQCRQVPEAFSLLSARSIAFGHWVWENLLKYASARLAGLPAETPVLIESGLPAFHRQSLELLYPGITIIAVDPFETVVVEQLWVAPTLHFASILERRTETFCWDRLQTSEAIVQPAMRDLAQRASLLRIDGPDRKVYLGRQEGRHRRLTNSGQIETLAIKRGYELVYPDELSPIEQLRLAQSASHFIAPQGSAVFLAYFSRPGTKIAVLNNERHELHAYMPYLRSADVELVEICGTVVEEHEHIPEWSDYEVDPKLLSALIDAPSWG